MPLNYYPYSTHLINAYRDICGQHCGILDATLATQTRKRDQLGIYVMYGNMPAYHKILIHPNLNMQYHLTGYGLFFEESLVRFLGEGIERYALTIAPRLMKDRIRYTSYNNIKKEGDVIPWEYIDIHSSEDYEKSKNVLNVRKPDQDSIIGWLPCPSLFEADKEIWVPAQFLFPGYRLNFTEKERGFAIGFSKGTSAHTDFRKALLGAMLEAIEMDPFIVKWYTMIRSPYIVLDDEVLGKNVSKILGKCSNFEVLPLLLNLDDTPAYSFGVALINKNEDIPFITFGTQVSLDPVKGLYRALVEAAAITSIGDYGPIVMPESYLKYPGNGPFMDLDKNVAYYLFPEAADEKRTLFENLTGSPVHLSQMVNLSSGNETRDIQYLLNKLIKISKYAVYLNITPPELINKGWHVIRVFVPEYANICLPGFPNSNHPRILKYGGIRNPYPHPLP